MRKLRLKAGQKLTLSNGQRVVTEGNEYISEEFNVRIRGIKGYVKKLFFSPVYAPLAKDLNANAKTRVNSDFENPGSNIKMSYELVVGYLYDLIKYIEKRNKVLENKMDAVYDKGGIEAMDGPEFRKLSMEKSSIPTNFPYKPQHSSHQPFQKYVQYLVDKYLMPLFRDYNDSLSIPNSKYFTNKNKMNASMLDILKEFYNQLEYWI